MPLSMKCWTHFVVTVNFRFISQINQQNIQDKSIWTCRCLYFLLKYTGSICWATVLMNRFYSKWCQPYSETTYSAIDNTGHNVTMDKYFTNVPLANDLILNHRLTTVGTIHMNKHQFPIELTNIRDRPLKSCLHLENAPTIAC